MSVCGEFAPEGLETEVCQSSVEKKLECIEQLNTFFFRGEGGCHSLTLKNTSNRESLDYHRKYLQNVRTKYLVIGLFGITQVFECRK